MSLTIIIIICLSMKIINNLFKGYMSALHLYNDRVRDIVLVDAGQSAGEGIIEGKNLYLMQDTSAKLTVITS